jgi:ATP-dependent protease ClpP protease subunit
MKFTSNIAVTSSADKAVIDIEGIIGVPEWWQFDNEEDKISTYNKFKDKINEIKSIKAKEIEVNIRSLGGNVNDALLIHDTLKSLDAKIITNAFGFTASAATTIHQAADKGNRRMSENGLYLIHKTQNEVSGTIYDMKTAINDMEKVESVIAGIYASNATNEEYNSDFYLSVMDRNNGEGEWLTADEALQLELIDTKSNPSQMNNMTDISNYHLPSIPENKIINKTKQMKIKEAWGSILNFLKVEKDSEITENQIESLNAGLTNQATEIANLTASLTDKDILLSKKDATITEKDTEIGNLKTTVTNLTSERDQLKADMTKTKEREDPAEHGEKTGNQKAYEEDAKNFNN